MSWRPHLDAFGATLHAGPLHRPRPPPPGMGAVLLLEEIVQRRLSAAAACEQHATPAAAGDFTTPSDFPQSRLRHNPPPPVLPQWPRTPLDALTAWAAHAFVLCLRGAMAAAATAGRTPPTPATPPPSGAAVVAEWPPRASGRAVALLSDSCPTPRAADSVAVHSTEAAAVSESARPAASSSASTSGKTTAYVQCNRCGTEARRRGHDRSADGDQA